MSVLSYKTRKSAHVRGMSKVYFCCHEKDFDSFFEDISNEILAKQNCSVWYHGANPVVYDDEFFARLSEMNLFVVPVTKRFLQENNPALNVEFRFAVEKGIPVLPLMQESGLDKRFNQLCGNIQYLDKYNTDSTCIEYTDKLDKFLSSVLLGDEMVQKIREAFDAYVFLSYRKKDRKYAQELMKLIHKNEFCRDIAIWYDEFLVPGEDFNDAISEALEKSDLFVLTVTPNLINEDNYIMDIEFPLAKKSQKPILPCEMVDTDKAVLAEKYEDIPECTNGRDDLCLSENLRQHFLNIAIKENDSSPEHLFFIGLAYLNGIDVEVDRKRALKLITSAAVGKLTDAISKLISMYSNGDGVKPNELTVLYWRKRLFDITQEKYQENPNYETAFAYMRACYELVDGYYGNSLFDNAITTANQLKNICETAITEVCRSEMQILDFKRHIALADMLLGQTYHATNDLKSAKKHYNNSKMLFYEINQSIEDPQLLRDTAILYVKIAQLCKVEANYKEALDYQKKALCIQQSNTNEDGNEIHLLDQVITRIRMSEIERLYGDIEASKQNCLIATNILDELAQIEGINKYINYKMFALYSLAESYRYLGDLAGALKTYEQLVPLEEIYTKQYGEAPMDIRAKRLAKLAQISFQLVDLESVIEYGEQALTIAEQTSIGKGEYIATGGSELACLYLFIGLAYSNGRDDNKNALKYMKLAVCEADKYIDRDIECNIPDTIMVYSSYGDLLQLNGDLTQAGECFKKAAHLCDVYLSNDENFRNVCTEFVLLNALGKNYALREMLPEAIETLNIAYELYNKMISMVPTVEDNLHRDVAQICSLLAMCYYDNNDHQQALEYYLKCVDAYERYPEEKYLLFDWNTLGITYYQLYDMSKGFLKRKKWKQSLIYVAGKIKQLYPTQYKQTFFYEELGDTGIFD